MSPTHVRQKIEIEKDIEINKERGREEKSTPIFLWRIQKCKAKQRRI